MECGQTLCPESKTFNYINEFKMNHTTHDTMRIDTQTTTAEYCTASKPRDNEIKFTHTVHFVKPFEMSMHQRQLPHNARKP